MAIPRLAVVSLRVGSVLEVEIRYPDVDEPVNKRDLSTGENGEFASVWFGDGRLAGTEIWHT